MRRKQLKLVVTFHTTAAAMAMERHCQEQGLPGRLIPVPRTLSAGCGLAWCTDTEQRAALRALMDRAGLEEEGIHECLV